jgi:hypothetical protein
MEIEHELEVHHEKPLPGWACAGIGVGFITVLVGLLVGVRLLAG